MSAFLRAGVVARIGQMADYWEQHLPEVIRTPAVVSALRAALEPAAVLPAPTDQTAALAEHLVERCPDHGCVEPPWEDGCHCEIVPLLRRLAGEAQQEPTQDGTVLAAENEALWDELHRRDTETDQPHPVARPGQPETDEETDRG